MNPFAFVILPLEFIPKDDYVHPGWQCRIQVKEFCKVATPRERFWVDTLRTMWPHGWNSAVPGRPVAAYALRQQQRAPMVRDDQQPEEYAKHWLQRWKANPEEAMQDACRQNKNTIRDTIHLLQARHKPEDLLVNGQSPVPAVAARNPPAGSS